MYNYDTVSQAVSGLQARGYIMDYNLEAECITCKETTTSLKPEEFEITEVHRFEGQSDPADSAIVYAIESKYGEKGILVNGYGVSAEEIGKEMVEKLKVDYLK